MDISVVIPTKDRLSHLRRVIPSYLMQDEVREIIVVVDGSTDGTLEFLEQLCLENEAIRYLNNGVNRGIPFSRNRGMDVARCEYIFMSEDDLELTENFFRTLSTHMVQIGADVICGRNIFRLDSESAGESIERTDRLNGSYVNMKSIEIETGMNIGHDQVEPIIASPMLAKASIFREIRYDEMFVVNFWREETDFQLSARERGLVLASCPHAVSFNFVIDNDRGGVHATVGLRREFWIVVNNWRFVKKHEKFILENFDVTSKTSYIVKFALGRLANCLILIPIHRVLSKTKRQISSW